MQAVLDEIRQELRQNADEAIRASSKRFFKEDVKTYGTKTAFVTKLAKKHFAGIKHASKAEVFALCDELWRSGYLEESFIACNWSYAIRKQYEPNDFTVFEKWVNTYVSNWAACDTLCNHTVGAFIEMYPAYVEKLQVWAALSNRWARRAAAVSLIVPARHGKFLNEACEIADILLLDQEDLVQKGYGWLLKSAAEKHQTEVFGYVMANKATMPRTALRYAIEKMPANLKTKAMTK